MKNMKKVSNGKSMKVIIGAGLIMALLLGTFFATKDKNKIEQKDSASKSVETKLNDNGDMVIPLSSVSENAQFYKYEVDGTKLEVIAIKAPDGSVRTAFNTCQVCYGSGRGYYKQEGDELVCQNCGNRFKASDVEVTKGGCNPVPIFDENKTVDKTNITISKDFLKEAKVIFENWKA